MWFIQMLSGNTMKQSIIFISLITLLSCSSTSEKSQTFERVDPTTLLQTEQTTAQQTEASIESKKFESEINIKELKGTLWIHRSSEEFPNCVDTLNFMNDATGYEYRCEFETFNKIDYFYSSDTLEIHEYGHVSEVHDLGLEIKYRWRYVRTNKKFKLTGYSEGTEKPIAPTSNDLTYELFKLNE